MKRRALLLLLCLGLARADERAPAVAPRAVREGRFATSLVCATCHSSAPMALALRDPQGRSVAPFDLWRASMMANSARDPLWRAAVAAEAAATPSRRAEIEAECVRCHAPMGALEAEAAGLRPSLAMLDTDDARGQLALDGVSCALCHQIPPEALGTVDSGRLTIGEGRVIWGPHEAPLTIPMQRFAGYTPTHGPHLLRSELCATCHTLHTETLAPDGAKTGHRLAEQTPYLEWKNSVFAASEGRTCQDCHLPTTDEDGAPLRIRIARNPRGGDFRIPERAPFGRHTLVGGNTLVPAILRDNGAALGALAPREAFEATLAATREQLTRRTATVAVVGSAVTVADGRARFVVRVESLVGHKLPSGFPELRRVWLRARVLDAQGRVLVASGEHDLEGRLIDETGAPLASELVGGPIEPHRDRVGSPREVALYEAVLADPEGRPTWRLLRGASYLKDDRLLPRGWRPDHPDAPITAPVGVEGDPDFTGGGDVARYDLPLPAGAAAATVEVALLYQPLGARFAAELFAVDVPEVKRLRALLDALPAADRAPVTLARTIIDLPR